MQDREIVAAIVAGEPGGLAAAYGRYAPALHAYCRSMLDEQDAADAVQDTFIIAADKLAGLRDPDRLRPWLYAVARNECRRRLRVRASTAPLDEARAAEARSVTGDTDPGTGAQRAELRVLVGEALAGMNPSDREIIELNLRHDLDGADLADALGMPRNQAHALASRARSHLETSLGALLVARSGRDACPELAGILSGWDGQMTPLLRKRINRHIDRCDKCGERKRRELSPAMLLGLLPVAALPVALREQVFRLVSGTSAAAAAHRAQVVERAGQFTESGFPEPLDPPQVRTHRPGHIAAAGAAAAFLAGAAALTFFLMHQPGSSPAGPQALGPRPHVFPSPVLPGGTPTSPAPMPVSPGPSGSTPRAPGVPGTGPGASSSPGQPSPGTPGSPSGSAQPSPSPSPATAPPSGSPSPTPAPSPGGGTLTESPATVYISPSLSLSGLTWWTGTFTLTAHGGRVGHYTVTVPSRYAGKLTVSPASGSLADGGSVRVTVRASVAGLFSRAKLTVSPGNATVTVCYSALGG